MAQLAIESVSHSFGALEVLHDVSFTVGRRDRGDRRAVGCGKSTLLSIAGGLLAPDAGRVLAGDIPASTSIR